MIFDEEVQALIDACPSAGEGRWVAAPGKALFAVIEGSLGGNNWAWRFDWNMLGREPARVLGHMTAASGRGPFELLDRPEAG